MDTAKFDRALQLAANAFRGDGPDKHKSKEWWPVAEVMMTSNAFTPQQTAQILGLSAQYMGRVVRERMNKPEGKRTYSGVAGIINPASIEKIRYIRVLTESHRKGTKFDAKISRMIRELLHEGNGMSVVAHLTGISRYTVLTFKNEE